MNAKPDLLPRWNLRFPPSSLFYRMINALAADEQDLSSDEATSDEASSLHHAQSIDQRLTEESTSEDSTSDDDDENAAYPYREPDPQLSNDRRASDASRKTATATKASDVTDSSEREASDEDPASSFLSPANARERRPTLTRGPGPEHHSMTSSIYAIHRPIAARRRTFTGEPGEAIKDGVYARQGEESEPIQEGHDDDEQDEHLSNLDLGGALIKTRSSRSSTIVSSRSVARKKLLADKLTDIFGLLDSEEVVAGES